MKSRLGIYIQNDLLGEESGLMEKLWGRTPLDYVIHLLTPAANKTMSDHRRQDHKSLDGVREHPQQPYMAEK